MKKMTVILLCLQMLFSMAVIAQENDLIYIDEGFIAEAEDGWDVTESMNWSYVGSAATATKNIISENSEKYLSLTSDAQKNGGFGGSYCLNATYYPVMGEGSFQFDIRMHNGLMSFAMGDDSDRSTLNHRAFIIDFDAEKGTVSADGNNADYSFEKSIWYKVDIDFDVNNSSYSVKFLDEADEVLVQLNDMAFEVPEIFFVSNFTFTMTGKMASSFDIKDIRYINHNTPNSSGGFMSIDENNIMHNTFPSSAIKTQELIDNQPDMLRRMEYLDRGLIATKRRDDVYLSWRWLGTEDVSTGYNVYRNGVKINAQPIMESTNFVDNNGGMDSKYIVKSVVDGVEKDESKEVGVNPLSAITISLKQYEKGDYYASDGTVGDIDGDGEYEIVLFRMPENVFEGNDYPLIEAYKLNGEHLWTMNAGPNLLGTTPLLVYDINGDGKSEIVLCIGDDFVDGTGVSVGDMDGDGVTNYRDNIYADRFFEKGPEYIAVFEGENGKLIDKVPMEGTISRDPLISWATGTAITHRPWSFHMTPLKVDDEETAFVFSRGIYGKTGMQCWKLVDNKLKMVWDFDSNNYFACKGQGNHNLTVGDVDFDGYDEIIYGSMAIDHNGELLYATGLGHGDAIHMSDFDLERPGLEVMKTNEYSTAYANCSMFDARTGEVLWGEFAGRDTTRVLCDDIDPRYKGGETHTNGKTFDAYGNVIDSQGGLNFAIYWDGDLLREMYDDITISKYMAFDDTVIPLLVADYCKSINGTKANCIIQADILGDWREELVLPTFDDKSLQIFTTTCPSTYKLYTLMHDPTYRMAIAWQNTGYNQPPHLGFNWGYDTKAIPIPKIFTEHDGIIKNSPYTDKNKEYEFAGPGEGYYAGENNTVIINGFAHLNDDTSKDNSKFTAETSSLLGHIIKFYDVVVESGGMLDYVSLPNTTMYLPPQIRLVSEEAFTVTDINGIPLERVASGVYYDAASGNISVDSDKSVWIRVQGESFEQILNIRGDEYIGENTFLHDTLDEKALGSGNDFLNGRMNINGWKLKGDSENVLVITHADGSYNPKKRLVRVINNSETEAVFYLNRDKLVTESKIVAEFEMQLRQGESEFEGEFMISSVKDADTSKKSIALKQVGDDLYVGTNGEYKLLASGLKTTTGNKSIYKIAAIMDFNAKSSDIVLMYYDNIIASMYCVDFYDKNEDGIACVMLSSAAGSDIGVDDIWIEAYSVPEIIATPEPTLTPEPTPTSLPTAEPTAQPAPTNTPSPEKECVKITAQYNDSGVLIGVITERITTTEITVEDNEVNCRVFYWDSLESMVPLNLQ